jgi:GTP pyrophosphokinase
MKLKKASKKDIEQVLSSVEHYLTKSESAKVRSAWNFCIQAHAGQKRKTGEDMAFHPLMVCKTLASWELDSTTLIAGLLHDVLEDTDTSEKDLTALFGNEVVRLVTGVTKVTGVHFSGNTNERIVENLRKMILVMAKDLRVVLVKLADRLHNMQTLYALSKDKQIENAKETLEIYAPLADRMQMGRVKAELEDLAFPYVYPSEYRDLMAKGKKMLSQATSAIKSIRTVLEDEFTDKGLPVTIDIRRKHLYSLWRKLQRPEIAGDLGKVYDLVAARVITESEADCYKAMGIVHGLYRPYPRLGVSDYIARPKPNGYRSIHTKVYGPNGRVFEIQIRSKQMHEDAEHGLSAHWNYSHAKAHGESDARLEAGKVSVKAHRFDWVIELANWQKDIRDSKEFLKAVKFDAFRERIFVYSPKGDAFDLPAGATPIDFAYAVHTDLGKFVKQAKVNDKIVPFYQVLQSGDVVEIIKTKEPKLPNADWLDFVLTTRARSEIAKYKKEVF